MPGTKAHDMVQVRVRARLQTTRGQGKSCFIVLRQRMCSLQCTCFADESEGGTVSKFMVKYCQQIPKESIVDVCGKLVEPAAPIEGCTQTDVELQISDIHVISRCCIVRLPASCSTAHMPIRLVTCPQRSA
jgi:aspartyl-tRNA synthetase